MITGETVRLVSLEILEDRWTSAGARGKMLGQVGGWWNCSN